MTSSNRVQKVKTVEEFDNVIKKGITIVEYGAEWCSPCQSSTPIFEALSMLYLNFNFVEVDVDELYDLCEKRGVGAAPSYQIYKNGEKVDELIGCTKAVLEEFIKKNYHNLKK